MQAWLQHGHCSSGHGGLSSCCTGPATALGTGPPPGLLPCGLQQLWPEGHRVGAALGPLHTEGAVSDVHLRCPF